MFQRILKGNLKDSPHGDPMDLSRISPREMGLLKDCLMDSKRLPKDSPKGSQWTPKEFP